MTIDLGTESDLRVSYPDSRGDRRVMSGPRIEVISRLRKLGFMVL